MLEGLVEAVKKGFYVDSSYKSNGWKIAFNYIFAVTQQLITLKQLKSKHNSYKKEWKVWKKLCGLSSQGQDKIKDIPIADKEVIEDYFKANLNTLKYYNILPAFLNLLKWLFNGVLAIGDYIRPINKVIKNYINPELFTVNALQASDLAEKEGKKKNKDNIEKDSKLKLA